MSNTPSFGPSQQGGQQYNPGTGPRFQQQPGQQYSGQQYPGQQQPGQQYPGQQWQRPLSTPPKKKGKGRFVWGAVGIVAALVIISTVASGGGSPEAAPASSAPQTTATAAGEVKQTEPAAQTTAAETTAAETTAAETTAPKDVAPKTTAPKTTAPQPPAGAKLGTPVTSGDLEFTLSKFTCGVSVTSLGSKLEPQGQFCLVEVSVKNVGKKEALLSDGDISLVDANGLEYSASSETLFVEGVLMFETINPGNKVAGLVYYDVPQDVKPTTATIKSGWFTKTQTVTLS